MKITKEIMISLIAGPAGTLPEVNAEKLALFLLDLSERVEALEKTAHYHSEDTGLAVATNYDPNCPYCNGKAHGMSPEAWSEWDRRHRDHI